jgi:hypothetical protein
MTSIEVKQEVTYDDLANLLWSGARDKWVAATDEQREQVWSLLCDLFSDRIPDLTTINDIIWFDCDDIFNEDDIAE